MFYELSKDLFSVLKTKVGRDKEIALEKILIDYSHNNELSTSGSGNIEKTKAIEDLVNLEEPIMTKRELFETLDRLVFMNVAKKNTFDDCTLYFINDENYLD